MLPITILWFVGVLALVVIVLSPSCLDMFESISMTNSLRGYPFRKSKPKSMTGNVTVYTGSETSSGINPDSYPITVNIKGVGKKKVYPIAVHQDEYMRDKCKILRVRKGKTDFYGHVVNQCKRSDPSCNNRFKNNASYLVDYYYKNANDYKARGLGNTINRGYTIEDTGQRISAAKLSKKNWHGWLTKNHITNPSWNCPLCC